jgi:hypothetical protein
MADAPVSPEASNPPAAMPEASKPPAAPRFGRGMSFKDAAKAVQQANVEMSPLKTQRPIDVEVFDLEQECYFLKLDKRDDAIWQVSRQNMQPGCCHARQPALRPPPAHRSPHMLVLINSHI